MDLPGLSSFLQNLVRDIVGWLFVAPNAFTLDLDAMMNGPAGGWATTETACGVLMIRVVEAKNLKNVEITGMSDPYADIRIRGRSVAKTRVIENNLNPYWGETFYILVHSLDDLLEMIVFDKDILKDRSLGTFKSSLRSIGLWNLGKMSNLHLKLSMGLLYNVI